MLRALGALRWVEHDVDIDSAQSHQFAIPSSQGHLDMPGFGWACQNCLVQPLIQLLYIYIYIYSDIPTNQPQFYILDSLQLTCLPHLLAIPSLHYTYKSPPISIFPICSIYPSVYWTLFHLCFPYLERVSTPNLGHSPISDRAANMLWGGCTQPTDAVTMVADNTAAAYAFHHQWESSDAYMCTLWLRAIMVLPALVNMEAMAMMTIDPLSSRSSH